MLSLINDESIPGPSTKITSEQKLQALYAREPEIK